jgi:2,4-dienoyl-CoA reductase-like NADH-dependent reductase (Old Yellow Enzyme family)
MAQEKFRYSSLQEVAQKVEELGVNIPLSENTDILKQPLTVNGRQVANRLAIQPMEGCDGTSDGAPDELTKRRYERFARSGAGIIWAEAIAITPEGRANPRQLMLTEKNLDDFKRMVDNIKSTCEKENGFTPVVIMQATHSGRYSKPESEGAPIIMYNNPIFEKDKPISKDRIATDDYLKSLEDLYGKSAKLAEKAGFDGVDIKACHRYLISESLSAYTRPGLYGGSFENRTWLFINAIKAAKAAVSGDTFITSRMNLYDGFAHPYGWGVSENGGVEPDMSEPVKLIDILHNQLGIELLDFTIGNPYFNPHVNRPFDTGPYESPEHPLVGVARVCDCIAEVKSHFKNLITISSANSYLRQFSINMAAGMIESGKTDIAGFGRMAFAYPQFANDAIHKGQLDPKKCCITCSKCSELMRSGTVAGCVIRDGEVYMPIYRENVLNNEKDVRHMISSF